MDIVRDYGRELRYTIEPHIDREKEAFEPVSSLLVIGGIVLGKKLLTYVLENAPHLLKTISTHGRSMIDAYINAGVDKAKGQPVGTTTSIEQQKKEKEAQGDPQAWEAVKELISNTKVLTPTQIMERLYNVYKAFGSSGVERILKEYKRVIIDSGKEPVKKPAARRAPGPKTTTVVPSSAVSTPMPSEATPATPSADETYGAY